MTKPCFTDDKTEGQGGHVTGKGQITCQTPEAQASWLETEHSFPLHPAILGAS